MPRLRKTEAQQRAEQRATRFKELYCVGKIRAGLTDEQCAAMIGVCRATLATAKKDPGKFRLEQLDKFRRAFGWTAEEVASIVGAN